MVSEPEKSTYDIETDRNRIKYIGGFIGHVFVDFFLVFISILMMATAFLVWRIADKPLDLSFTKSSIESALQNPETGVGARLDGVFLHWPDLTGPLLLAMTNVNVLDPKGHIIVAVDEAALGISSTRLLIGKISPLALILKAPALNIRRTVNGITIGYNASNKIETSPKKQSNLTERILGYIAAPDQHTDDASPLATLKQFKIQNAVLSVEDDILKTSWTIPQFDIHVQNNKNEGLTAEFHMVLDSTTTQITETKDIANIQGSVSYTPTKNTVHLDSRFNNLDVQFFADKLPDTHGIKNQDIELDGSLTAQLDTDGVIDHIHIKTQSAVGNLFLPDHYDSVLPYKNLALDASYTKNTQKIILNNISADLHATGIQGQASLSLPDNKQDPINGQASLKIDKITQAQLKALWPKSLAEEAATEWLIKKISGGFFQEALLTTNLSVSQTDTGWSIHTPKLEGSFKYADMNIAYLHDLAPLQNATGTGSIKYDEETLTITADSGQIKGLEVTDSKLFIDKIATDGGSTADLKIGLKGPLSQVLSYIEDGRIGAKHGFNLNAVKGQTAVNVGLYFKTLKDIKTEDVDIHVTGKVQNARLPDVTNGLDITNGMFDVLVKGNTLNITGTGLLDGRTTKMRYTQFLDSTNQPYKTAINAQLTADVPLARSMGADIQDYIAGLFPVNVTYTDKGNGQSDVVVEADITPAQLFFDPFAYRKSGQDKGHLNLNIALQNGKIRNITNFDITTQDARIDQGRFTFAADGSVQRIDIPAFEIGKNRGKARVDIAPSGSLNISLTGSTLDARPFLDKEPGSKTTNDPPMTISLDVAKMQTNDNELVKNVKMFIDIDDQGRFNQLEMDAMAGGGAVYLRYKPDETGKRVFRFEADNAGATLRAFGLYDKIRGGKMIIHGEPLSNIYDRNVVGKAQLTDFSVVKAPALARLLGALSLPGLLQTLDGKGVSFSKLEAGFDWLYRPNGSLLVLKDGRTSGNAMGLTFDGTFDNAKGVVDVSGTVIPLSDLNKIIGNIPVVGDILTGGSGSVFAATYTMKGPGEDPKVSVNPLSVLTPGFLRRILFEGE